MPLFTYSARTATSNVCSLMVVSSSLAALWTPVVAAAVVAGNVIVAIAPSAPARGTEQRKAVAGELVADRGGWQLAERSTIPQLVYVAVM